MQISSRTVEEALDMKPSTLRLMAEKILPKHGKQGTARKWSVGDMTLIMIAQMIMERGMNSTAAVHFAKAVGEKEVVRMIADENAKCSLVAWPDRNARCGFGVAIAHDFDELAALIIDEDTRVAEPMVFDIRRIFDIAFRFVAAAVLDEKSSYRVQV